MLINVNKADTRQQEQVVGFSDQTAAWVYEVPSEPDSTFGMTDTADATLDNFFLRPVRVSAVSWEVGTPLYEYLDVWTSYFTNKRVLNRLNNYNLVRAKLHVRIMLNGNGFYFGRVLASYLPRPTEIADIPLPRALYPEDMVGMSQRPHVMLDPTTSQGGEFVLPFFHRLNNLSVPKDEWAQMGVIILKDLNPLYHANAATEPITITTYVWAEGIELAIPTSTGSGAIVPQMGDEYGLKPVSSAANTVARAAGSLVQVPGIAPYAKATQEAAKAVSNVASIFGYSRPPTLDPPITNMPQYLGNLANTNVPESHTKLTMDCKQEVTVDPRVTGLAGIDEMSILSIAKRESFLTTVPWQTARPLDSVLGSFVVGPMAFLRSSGIPESQENHLTPICFAALPFKYWRGSIRFRFQVVASNFHKGRLRIVYDPYILQSASVVETNVNYSYIVDIAEERDFTLSFGWGQEVAWRRTTPLPSVTYPSGVLDTIITSTPDALGSNGCLSIAVVNELTVPNDSCPDNVAINVFISAGDDFEVCVPECSNLAQLSYSRLPATPTLAEPIDEKVFEPQMGETADASDQANESIPQSVVDSQTLSVPIPLRDHSLDVYFGDPVVSFRQCLKRYEFVGASTVETSGTAAQAASKKFAYFTFPTIPLFRGFTNGGIHRAIHTTVGTSTSYNFTKFTLLNYLLPAFAGRRGGIRWKYHLVGATINSTSAMIVSDSQSGAGYGSGWEQIAVGTSTPPQPSRRAAQWLTYWPHTWCASHATMLEQNPALEVEFPYYSAARFAPTRRLDYATAGNPAIPYHTVRIASTFGSAEVPALLSYVSVAEDFNLFFFCGVPILYSYPEATPVTAV